MWKVYNEVETNSKEILPRIIEVLSKTLAESLIELTGYCNCYFPLPNPKWGQINCASGKLRNAKTILYRETPI